jgi:hypothetical protein
MAKIEVKGTEITVYSHSEEDYICITDIARHKNAERTDDLIRNWIRNRNTIEFLGIWEMLNNPDFKPVEFDGFKKQAGLNCAGEQHAGREKKRLNGLIEKNLKKVKING